ncbi:hypothetical protein V7152_18870 [Neobacillus drentensis]|uniref:hypothetical protein n=1 Tax=Neobacillus drentensis TaxID=220684 RepID=UPI002FFDA57E
MADKDFQLPDPPKTPPNIPVPGGPGVDPPWPRPELRPAPPTPPTTPEPSPEPSPKPSPQVH